MDRHGRVVEPDGAPRLGVYPKGDGSGVYWLAEGLDGQRYWTIEAFDEDRAMVELLRLARGNGYHASDFRLRD